MIDNLEFSNISYINKKIKSYKIINFIIIILVIIILFSYFIKYELIYSTYGYVIKNGDYYIKLNVYEESINNVVKGKALTLDNYIYNYTVISISEDLYIDSINMKNYKEVVIKLKEKRDYIVNEILNIKINLGKKRILKIILDYIFGKE